MKKFLSIILSIICASCFNISVLAASTKLMAENVSVKAGDTFEIKYSISGNSGVMGFGFNLSYDTSAFEAIEVKKGSSLNTGIFNDSIGSSKKDTVKVVWTGTENFKGNGELFTVVFQAKDSASGSYSFNIHCLEDDTFNENWADVNIDCKSISVDVENENAKTGDIPTSIWSKIVKFFKKVIDFIASLFK